MKASPNRPLAGQHQGVRVSLRWRAITLLELLVVVLIIGILATIGTNVYTGQTLKARNAATRNTIRELMVAIVRFEVDTGELPLSGSGTVNGNVGSLPVITSRTPSTGITNIGARSGCGFLYLELTHSLSGRSGNPYPSTWAGPYLDLPAEVIQSVDNNGASLPIGEIQILDSFGEPFEYVNYLEYLGNGVTRHFDINITTPATGIRGTRLFNNNKPQTAQMVLPANNPFFVAETFYNPRTFQIWSTGFNETTFDGISPPSDDPGVNFQGTEFDDITNFGY